MIANFENHLVSKADHSDVHLIPKRQWENAFGVWENFLYDVTEYTTFIAPRGKQIATQFQVQSALPLTKQELIEAGLYNETAKIEEPKKQVAAKKPEAKSE